MKLDYVQDYMTPEELDRLGKQYRERAQAVKDHDFPRMADLNFLISWTRKTGEERYRKARNTSQALADAKEYLKAITLEDCENDPSFQIIDPTAPPETRLLVYLAESLDFVRQVFPDDEKARQRLMGAIRAAVRRLLGGEPASLKPKKLIIPNDAMTNSLINPERDYAIILRKAKEDQEEVKANLRVFIADDDLPGGGATLRLVNGKALTEYQRQVTSGIITLYMACEDAGKDPILTVPAIHRAMIHGGETLTPGQAGAITKALNYFHRLGVIFNPTEALRKMGQLEYGCGVTYGTEGAPEYWLNFQAITILDHGKKVTAYKILAEPVALAYARLTKQMVTIPATACALRQVEDGKILQDKPLMMDEDRTAIAGYMARRIEVMRYHLNEARKEKAQYDRQRAKQKKAQAKDPDKYVDPPKPLKHFNRFPATLLFDTILKEVGILVNEDVNARRKAFKRYRDFCLQALDYWTACDYIKGYKLKRQGQQIVGVEVQFEPAEQTPESGEDEIVNKL